MDLAAIICLTDDISLFLVRWGAHEPVNKLTSVWWKTEEKTRLL